MPLAAQLLLTAGTVGLSLWLARHLALIPWRRSAGSHWTEQARVLWPARFTGLWAGVAGGIFALVLNRSLLETIPHPLLTVAGMFGAMPALFPSVRELEPRYRFRSWIRENGWILLVRGATILIGFALLATMPPEMDAAAWARFGVGFVAAAFLASGLWLPWVMGKGGGDDRLVSMRERLDRITDEAASEAGVRPRHVWLADSAIPNAVAFPLVGAVTFTSRTMELLDDAECRAVMGHELAHLREPGTVRILRLAGAMGFFIIVFLIPAMHAWGLTGPAILLLAFLVFSRVVAGVQRRMELRADLAATGKEEGSPAYARALEKLYEAGRLPAVMPGNRMVHPHLYDRMIAAGVTPDYPRPAAPSRWSVVNLACLFLAIAGLVLLFNG